MYNNKTELINYKPILTLVLGFGDASTDVRRIADACTVSVLSESIFSLIASYPFNDLL